MEQILSYLIAPGHQSRCHHGGSGIQPGVLIWTRWMTWTKKCAVATTNAVSRMISVSLMPQPAAIRNGRTLECDASRIWPPLRK